ncbi:hypothetical protein [Chromobacterium sphagni]|uniref:Uncharacterized protein n=1 Tax=Chromobacterium sphagni TaxID=1903179 RepID=A0A1S1X527_9NEIS|nr:hypothetical protein [Chromobacterium sphagni]OHX14577.1 hypothetical protein BI347_14475 [Chromobacterium sphagni]OHX20637.1 hypothetical protein BI344_14870 [Chromobacterium sphagni]
MPLLAALQSLPNQFCGEGINHEDQTFTGCLHWQALPGQRALLLHYSASGIHGEILHRETTLLGYLPDGTMCLWPVMEELPFILPHPAVRLAEGGHGTLEVVFASAPRSLSEQFRQEITIRLEANGQMLYTHAWGLPNCNFEDRSRCTMSPVAGTA